jgi:hypothetical protein
MRSGVRIVAVSMTALSLMFMEVGLAAADHTSEDFMDFIITANVGDDPAPKLQDPRAVGTFRYQRHLATPTLDAAAGWVDGDRKGYQCAYTFLAYRGFIVGRATYSYLDPPGDGNEPRILDRFMDEGARNYDGTLNTYDVPAGGGEAQPAPGRSCPFPLEKAYDPLTGDPGPKPVVTFQHGPHTIEVRDHADAADIDNVGPGHKFSIVSESNERIEVIAFQDGSPVLAIHYDLMTTAVIPGTDHPVTMFSNRHLEGTTTHHLKVRTKGGRATISGRIQPPAPGEKVSLTFFANGSPHRKIAKKSDTLNTDSRFRKSFRVPADSTRCRIRVAFQGDAVGKKTFRC